MPTRRGFLARIGAAAIGLTLAAKLPGIASAPPRLAAPMGNIITVRLPQRFVVTSGDVMQIGGEFMNVVAWDGESLTVERGHA